MSNSIKIGWGEVSIVPENRTVNLSGQFYERITDKVETPITVTALALECGDDSAIFCSCDLVSTSRHLLLSVRDRLSKIDGFPTDKLIINAIHTHTSLSFARLNDNPSGSSLKVFQEIMPNAKYEKLVAYDKSDLLSGEEAHEFLADRIAEAAKKAWQSRTEGAYAQGFGRAAIGMCRRVCYTDGSAKMWGDTDTACFTTLEGGNDSGIELLYTFTPERKLTGIIANVACPAQVLEHRSFMSSDYFGKTKEMLRKKFGDEIFLLGLVSPAGDQCPRDMIRWVEPETPINDPNIVRINPTERKADPSMFDVRGCERVARRLSDEIIYAYEEISDKDFTDNTVLIHKNITVDMPLRKVTPLEEENARRAIMEFAAKNGDRPINYADNAAMHIHAGTISRKALQESVDVIPIEVHILRLGSIAFATNPYELFLDYGNAIRARSKAQQTFLIQLSCGSLGYLPTEKAERGSHYSAYVSSGTAGHEGGELLVRKTVSEINGMF